MSVYVVVLFLSLMCVHAYALARALMHTILKNGISENSI